LRFPLTRMIETRTDCTSRVIHIAFDAPLLKNHNLARLVVRYFRVAMILSKRPYFMNRERHCLLYFKRKSDETEKL
jgi:hypothetical protein